MYCGCLVLQVKGYLEVQKERNVLRALTPVKSGWTVNRVYIWYGLMYFLLWDWRETM